VHHVQEHCQAHAVRSVHQGLRRTAGIMVRSCADKRCSSSAPHVAALQAHALQPHLSAVTQVVDACRSTCSPHLAATDTQAPPLAYTAWLLQQLCRQAAACPESLDAMHLASSAPAALHAMPALQTTLPHIWSACEFDTCLQFLGGAAARRDGKGAGDVVAKGPVVRMLLHRHQLHGGVARGLYARQHRVCSRVRTGSMSCSADEQGTCSRMR
jgi:hypothetical protein